MDDLTKRLVLAAIAEAADVMDTIDPDDRYAAQRELVEVVKEWLTAANDGDDLKAALLIEAVPSWGHFATGAEHRNPTEESTAP